MPQPQTITGYADRCDAGVVLSRHIAAGLDDLVDPVIVGIPRGGVVVADEVARRLGAPLSTIVVRKVGAPYQPEFAIGAVDEEGAVVLGPDAAAIPRWQLDQLVESATAEALRRARTLRSGQGPPHVADRDVIVVDDGYATGMTARATARYLRRHGARRVILAVPVGPRVLLDSPPPGFDRVICPFAPANLGAVGLHYGRFEQVSDAEVRRVLTATGRSSRHLRR